MKVFALPKELPAPEVDYRNFDAAKEDAALAAGATPTELQSLTDLQTGVDAKATALAAAVAANTPAPPA